MAKVTKKEEIVSVTLELSLEEAEMITGVFGSMTDDFGYSVYKGLRDAGIVDHNFAVEIGVSGMPYIVKSKV